MTMTMTAIECQDVNRMPPLLAIDWNINPLVFLEFFVVLAFGIGWLILERVASRYDKTRDIADAEKPASQDQTPS
jgi:hypothetical protein